jgi:hypothetical protein
MLEKYQQHLLDEGKADPKLAATQPSPEERTELLLRTADSKVAEVKKKLGDGSFSSKARRFAEGTIKCVLKGTEFVSVAVSKEPHAALAWAGFSVILPVSLKAFLGSCHGLT